MYKMTDKFGNVLSSFKRRLEKYGLYYQYATINDDGTIDYDGNVILRNRRLKTIPFKFRKINGNFDLSWNHKIKSLDGIPSECIEFTYQGIRSCLLKDITTKYKSIQLICNPRYLDKADINLTLPISILRTIKEHRPEHLNGA